MTEYMFLCETNNRLVMAWERNVFWKIYCICWLMVYFHFLADYWWILPMLQAQIKQERLWSRRNSSFIKRYKTDVAHFFQQHSVSELNDQITKKRGLWSCYFVIFVGSIHFKGCLRIKNFPAKRLRKKLRAS